jgi:hypothetical protein
MRNLFLRSSLLVAALLLATTLLASDFSAEPAGAMTTSRGPAVQRSSGAVRRPSPAARRINRARFRASRSAVRPRMTRAGGRYGISTGNGFYGAYQFHPRTWRNLGYPGLPHQASPEMQDEAARKLQARSGWGQWPVCSRRIGARR